MQIKSTAFDHGGMIPRKFTCDDKGVNPPLSISEIPGGAKSLALIVYDPDVPEDIREDGLWNHWIVYNMPPAAARIEEDSVPEGQVGAGTSGMSAYQGPCPPDGEHRYIFRLIALDSRLDLPDGASRGRVEEAMEGHVIDTSELMGRYDREL